MPRACLLPPDKALDLVVASLTTLAIDPAREHYLTISRIANYLAVNHGMLLRTPVLTDVVAHSVERFCPHVLPLRDYPLSTLTVACSSMRPDGLAVILGVDSRVDTAYRMCFSEVSDMIMFRLLLV